MAGGLALGMGLAGLAPIPGQPRVFLHDPFGNEIEIPVIEGEDGTR